MHQLLLLRHAKAASADPAMSDRDRPLTPGGRRAAHAMRRAMRDLGLAPDLILVSSAKRTLETMAVLEPWDDTPLVDAIDDLYLASDTRWLSTLREVTETVRTVLAIGHNPGLHELALSLTDPRISAEPATRALEDEFPTAGLAEFSIAGPWSRLDRSGGRLIRFLTPRALDPS